MKVTILGELEETSTVVAAHILIKRESITLKSLRTAEDGS